MQVKEAHDGPLARQALQEGAPVIHCRMSLWRRVFPATVQVIAADASHNAKTIVPTPCQSLVGTVPSLAPLPAPGSNCSRLALPHDTLAQNTHLRPQR